MMPTSLRWLHELAAHKTNFICNDIHTSYKSVISIDVYFSKKDLKSNEQKNDVEYIRFGYFSIGVAFIDPSTSCS